MTTFIVLERDGAACAIRVSGQFTWRTMSRVEAVVDKQLKSGCTQIDLDLSGIEILDGSALGAIRRIAREARRRDCQLVSAENMAPQILGLLHLTQVGPEYLGFRPRKFDEVADLFAT